MNRELNSIAGWERESKSGTLCLDRKGSTPADRTRYRGPFFELMDHVDATCRTFFAAPVDAR